MYHLQSHFHSVAVSMRASKAQSESVEGSIPSRSALYFYYYFHYYYPWQDRILVRAVVTETNLFILLKS